MSDFRMVVAGLGRNGGQGQGGRHRIPAELANAEATGLVIPVIVDLDTDSAVAYQAKYRDPEFLAWLRGRGYDVSSEAADMFLSARIERRIEDALEIGVDAVTSVVPAAAKMHVARAAAEAGAHLFVDKPVAPTAAEAEELYAMFSARGLYLQDGYHLADMVDPVIELMKRENVRINQWRLSWTRVDGVPDAAHFTDPAKGGVTRDIASHLARLISPLTGHDPIAVLEANAKHDAGPDRAETGMDSLLELPDGGRARIIVDWRTRFGAGEQLELDGWGPEGERLSGRLHANRYDDDRPDPRAFAVVLRREDDHRRPFLVGGEPPLYVPTMIKGSLRFHRGCTHGWPIDHSPVLVERAVEGMLTAARTGREVSLA